MEILALTLILTQSIAILWLYRKVTQNEMRIRNLNILLEREQKEVSRWKQKAFKPKPTKVASVGDNEKALADALSAICERLESQGQFSIEEKNSILKELDDFYNVAILSNYCYLKSLFAIVIGGAKVIFNPNTSRTVKDVTIERMAGIRKELANF